MDINFDFTGLVQIKFGREEVMHYADCARGYRFREALRKLHKGAIVMSIPNDDETLRRQDMLKLVFLYFNKFIPGKWQDTFELDRKEVESLLVKILSSRRKAKMYNKHPTIEYTIAIYRMLNGQYKKAIRKFDSALGLLKEKFEPEIKKLRQESDMCKNKVVSPELVEPIRDYITYSQHYLIALLKLNRFSLAESIGKSNIDIALLLDPKVDKKVFLKCSIHKSDYAPSPVIAYFSFLDALNNSPWTAKTAGIFAQYKTTMKAQYSLSAWSIEMMQTVLVDENWHENNYKLTRKIIMSMWLKLDTRCKVKMIAEFMKHSIKLKPGGIVILLIGCLYVYSHFFSVKPITKDLFPEKPGKKIELLAVNGNLTDV